MKKLNSSEERAVLSAIWILSCTDKVPQMTYRSVIERVDTKLKIEQIKEIVDKRIELFREGIPLSQLRVWKNEMKAGENRALWIANSPKDTQNNLIDNLEKKDVFRNRFRNSLKADPTPANIIEWGLNHIKDMHVLETERYEKRKNTFTSIWIPLFSLLIAGGSIWTSYKTTESKIDADNFKTTLSYKHKGYSKFMVNFSKVNTAAVDKNRSQLFNSAQDLTQSYYEIEPFINKDTRNDVYQQLLNYEGVSSQHVIDSLDIETYLGYVVDYRNFFRDKLSPVIK